MGDGWTQRERERERATPQRVAEIDADMDRAKQTDRKSQRPREIARGR